MNVGGVITFCSILLHDDVDMLLIVVDIDVPQSIIPIPLSF